MEDNFKAESYDISYTKKQLIKRIWQYIVRYRMKLIIIVTLIILVSVINIMIPILYSEGISKISSKFRISDTYLIMSLLLLANIASWFFGFLRHWISEYVLGNVTKEIREDAFRSVMKQDGAFFDETNTGNVSSRIIYDTQSFFSAINLTFELFSNIFILVPVMIACFYINAQLAGMMLAMVPVIVILPIIISKIRKALTEQNQRGIALINSKTQETIQCITVAKNFRQESKLYKEFCTLNNKVYKTKLYWGLMGAFTNILDFFVGLATVVILYFGGKYVLEGSINSGGWYLFVQSISIFWWPITSICSFWNDFQEGIVAGERVFALIDAKNNVIQKDNKIIDKLNGDIEFKNINFAYVKDANVLNNFSLKIKHGETIALVGPSGAGKSSLGKLISRFYEFQQGELCIDGRDIRQFDLISYRKRLGVIPQIPYLFSGTVMDNIRYAVPEASEEDIYHVANEIDDGKWINSLPDGIHTEIGDGGKGISLGQKQLISLARVMIQNPDIIIMDEATSNIDPVTEMEIQSCINRILKDKTAIVIAHRLSTIKSVDKIVVIDNGNIEEQGKHEELLKKNARYAELYHNYFEYQEVL